MANNEGPKRRRRRNVIQKKNRKEIADRVCNFYESTITNNQDERYERMQRYAKYRMWSRPSDWPWPDASNVAVPDMFQDSVRVQDTLHNAVMSQDPPVVARATLKADQPKEDAVNKLITHQVFTEQPGERFIGDLVESFVNDPAVTAFVPWIRERKTVSKIKLFPKIPEDLEPIDYFTQIVVDEFPEFIPEPSAAGWDWTLTPADETEDADPIHISFYTDEEDKIEMVMRKDIVVYDGPKLIVKDFDDVIYPTRSANLQSPSPSNPGGASFVILRDFPTKHEILDLIKSGYYEFGADEDTKEKIKKAKAISTESDREEQKDQFSGQEDDQGLVQDDAHSRLTRLMCFDKYDIDGDGIAEDVIFWVIKETGTLLRARLLSDVNPGTPPERPVYGESIYPVNGRYAGISMLESMEAIHDATKVLVDQIINSNDLSIASPGFYRPGGGLNPEELRIEPFTLTPMGNPDQDVAFPQIGNPQAVAQGFNLISMFGGWQDKSTMVTDMSFGQIPTGASSALRTIGGMSMIQGQSEARPERILRRLFMLLVSIWRHIHRMNQSFLPKQKQFRIAGVTGADKDPFITVNRDSISGEFQFTFAANVFNTSKAALQESLSSLMQAYVSQIAIQLGISTPDTIYNLLRDYTLAQGQDPTRYANKPNPKKKGPGIFAEEALTMVMRHQVPMGEPAEQGGYQEHLQTILKILPKMQDEGMDDIQRQVLTAYLQSVKQGVDAEVQQQQMEASAAEFQGQTAQRGPGAPVTNPQAPPNQPPAISGPEEMVDESLPTAGGGANRGEG